MRSFVTVFAASLVGTLLLSAAHVDAKIELSVTPRGIFAPSSGMIKALDDNDLINVARRVEIALPPGAVRNETEYIPNQDKPDVILIKNKKGKCLRRVEYRRSDYRKVSKELRFYTCHGKKGSKKDWIGTVELDHTWVMSKVKKIKVERPRFNITEPSNLALPHYFKWSIEVDRTPIANQVTQITVKRNWNTTAESVLRYKRSTFTNKIKGKEEIHKVHSELLDF